MYKCRVTENKASIMGLVEFLALDSFTFSLTVIGSILVGLGWLIQLIRTVFKRSTRLRQNFVLLYAVGSSMVVVDQFPGSFTMEFLILAIAPLLALVIFMRVKR